MIFEFTLAFRYLDLQDDTVVRRLVEAMPDAHWLARDGEVHATVRVNSPSPVEGALAVEALVRHVVPTARATHVVEDLVAIPDIAVRVGVDREAVRHWVNGTRGPGSFPRPRGMVGDRVKVWDWPVVQRWLKDRLGTAADAPRFLTAREVAMVNVAFDAPPEGLAAGIAVSAEHLTGVLTDHTGRVFARGSRPIARPGTPDQAGNAIKELLGHLNAKRGSQGDGQGAKALGVHVGGHVDRQGRVIIAPHYQAGRDWKSTDLRTLLEEMTGLPTVVQNDANSLALYERNFGIGSNAQDFVVVLLNTGVGAGIVSGGQLLTGWQGAAGEVGHLVVVPGGFHSCTCGNDNCLECVAGIPNLVRSIGAAAGQEVTTLEEALELAEHSDLAQESLRIAGEALGRACSMAVNLMNPSHLVLYAPPELLKTKGEAPIFMQEVNRTLKQHSFSTTKNCDIVLREWDPELSAIGAALGALRTLG